MRSFPNNTSNIPHPDFQGNDQVYLDSLEQSFATKFVHDAMQVEATSSHQVIFTQFKLGCSSSTAIESLVTTLEV